MDLFPPSAVDLSGAFLPNRTSLAIWIQGEDPTPLSLKFSQKVFGRRVHRARVIFSPVLSVYALQT